jgi:hypothetical protein
MLSLIRWPPFSKGWPGISVYLLGIGVLAALVLGGALMAPMIFRSSPYEGWDEGMAYTEASHLSSVQHYQNATYGSIEEFKFRVANFIYKHFDPIGKTLSPRRWTNNLLASYLRPSAIFDSPDFDATASRGILDRRPFLIARFINLIGGLILAAVLCCFWLARYRYPALFLILPLLWFLVSFGYLQETIEVTPNGWNALLAIIVFVCLTDVIERRRPLRLYISAVLLGFGANSKIDFLFLGGPIFVTWIVADWEARSGLRRWVKPALLCAFLFLATLILTNPRLLYALPLAIAEQARLLQGVRSEAVDSGAPSLNYNYVTLFREFLAQCVGAPWNVAKLHSLSVAAAIGICGFFPVSIVFSSDLDTRKKWSLLVVLSSFYVLLWVVPLLSVGDAHDRYFLSGTAIAMISLGYGCLYFWRENSWLRRVLALLVICSCAVLYLGRLRDVGWQGIKIEEQLADGLDRTMSRNQAVLKIIQLIESGNYSKQVIVDQHSYTDIRSFLEKGIPVTLVNVFNFQSELEKFRDANKPTLGLYVPGKGMGSAAWEGKWNDQDSALYDRYIKYLSGFETLAKFGSNPMFLLDWGPVDPNDEVVIFENKRASIN